MNTQNTKNAHDVLSNLSPQDFLTIGLDHLAYIRPLGKGGQVGLYAANGHLIFETLNVDEAVIMARQNNLFPVTVH